MRITGSEPYYPTPIAGGDNSVVSAPTVSYTYDGITIRQEFAKAAMQGFCADQEKMYLDPKNTAELIAFYSVLCADALIEKLNR